MNSYNFSAGPAALPQEVKNSILAEFKDHLFDESSIMEISHRSDKFVGILNRAEDTAKRIFNLDDDFEVLFVSGGASIQFDMIPLNFAINKKRVAFINSGHFTELAQKQAAEVQGVETNYLASTKDDSFHRLPLIPQQIDASKYDYLHLVINNTVEGSCYHPQFIPNSLGVPIVADMTSCLGEEVYDLNKFDLVMSSAQKNLGIAGITIVLVRKSWVKDASLVIPSNLRYQKYIDSNSSFNTPATFPIYVTGKVFEWIEQSGGVSEMERRARERSGLLYEFIDNSPLFTAPVKKEDRSIANVVFTTGDAKRDLMIAQDADKVGLHSIKGYRGVGGLRASLYNGMPLDGVKALIKFLKSLS